MRIKDGDGNKRDIDIFFDKVSTKGRPQKVLTEEALKVIESLASKMCPEEEIANCLGVSLNTLKNEQNKDLFDSAIKKGFSYAKQSLRQKEFELAMKGNATMIIFLAKNYLGQSDKAILGIENEEEEKQMVKELLEQAKAGGLNVKD